MYAGYWHIMFCMFAIFHKSIVILNNKNLLCYTRFHSAEGRIRTSVDLFGQLFYRQLQLSPLLPQLFFQQKNRPCKSQKYIEIYKDGPFPCYHLACPS